MRKGRILFCLFICLTAAGCGRKAQTDKSMIYKIYAVNKEETKIFPNEYEAKNSAQTELIQELLFQLSNTPEKLEYKAPLAGGFKLLDYSVSEGQLILNFDDRYKEQSVTTEILTRAAIVRTMTQIKGIDYVSFQVKAEPLADSAGAVVGIMSADMFIDNAGSEINSFEQVQIRLYFTNKEGNRLVETSRKIRYNTNISIEKLVVEQLIGGPGDKVEGQAYPVINPETKIIGVTVKDGTCYVNLNEAFLTQVHQVTSDVTIYSITNSLVELPNVNKVQIAVNGDTNILYREHTSFTTPFERNLDLVITQN